MTTDTSASFLSVLKWTDDECRAYLERQHWPDGPICPKCGAPNPYTITRKSPSKNGVKSLYRCRACKRQYTATVGTIFEDSHIPLSKWFAAIYLMCSSKKGMSAHQIHRQLTITYRSAWFMCHRIREAMEDSGEFPLLVGTIEADETFVGGKPRGHRLHRQQVQREYEAGLRDAPPPHKPKAVVFGMMERGGTARTRHVLDATRETLEPLLTSGIDLRESRLMTDGNPAYAAIEEHLPHGVIRHESEYVRGEIHTQGIENYWSILKRGLYGVFHPTSVRHICPAT
jgi:transposase-like protein